MGVRPGPVPACMHGVGTAGAPCRSPACTPLPPSHTAAPSSSRPSPHAFHLSPLVLCLPAGHTGPYLRPEVAALVQTTLPEQAAAPAAREGAAAEAEAAGDAADAGAAVRAAAAAAAAESRSSAAGGPVKKVPKWMKL